MDSSFERPFIAIEQIPRNLVPQSEGIGQYDITGSGLIPVTIADLLHGSIRCRRRMQISFSGTEQSYIGKVVENPDRRILGGYSLSSSGFTNASTAHQFHYKNEQVVLEDVVTPVLWPSAQISDAYSVVGNPLMRLNIENDAYIRANRLDYIPKYFSPGNSNTGEVPSPLGFVSGGTQGQGILTAIATTGELTAGGGVNTGGSVVTNRYYPIEGHLVPGDLPLFGEMKGFEMRSKGEQLATETIVGNLKPFDYESINIWLRQGVGANITIFTEKIGLYNNRAARPATVDEPLVAGAKPDPTSSFISVVTTSTPQL